MRRSSLLILTLLLLSCQFVMPAVAEATKENVGNLTLEFEGEPRIDGPNRLVITAIPFVASRLAELWFYADSAALANSTAHVLWRCHARNCQAEANLFANFGINRKSAGILVRKMKSR